MCCVPMTSHIDQAGRNPGVISHTRCPMWAQGSELGYSSAVFPEHLQDAGSEVEQLGLELEPTGDTGTAVAGLS